MGRLLWEWGISFGGVENRESCRWSGALLFGMGNSLSGVGVFFLVWAIALGVGNLLSEWGVFGDTTLVWAIVVLVWEFSFWCGKLA